MNISSILHNKENKWSKLYKFYNSYLSNKMELLIMEITNNIQMKYQLRKGIAKHNECRFILLLVVGNLVKYIA